MSTRDKAVAASGIIAVFILACGPAIGRLNPGANQLPTILLTLLAAQLIGLTAAYLRKQETVHMTVDEDMGKAPTPEEIADSKVSDILGRPCYYRMKIGLSAANRWRESYVTSIHSQDRLTMNAGFTCDLKDVRWKTD